MENAVFGQERQSTRNPKADPLLPTIVHSMGPHPNRLLNAAMAPTVPTCTTVDQCQIPTGKENIPFGLKNGHAGGCIIVNLPRLTLQIFERQFSGGPTFFFFVHGAYSRFYLYPMLAVSKIYNVR